MTMTMEGCGFAASAVLWSQPCRTGANQQTVTVQQGAIRFRDARLFLVLR